VTESWDSTSKKFGDVGGTGPYTWAVDAGLVGKAQDIQKEVNAFFRSLGIPNVPAYDIREVQDARFGRSNGWFTVNFATPIKYPEDGLVLGKSDSTRPMTKEGSRCVLCKRPGGT
jgi:hypothetical protein